MELEELSKELDNLFEDLYVHPDIRDRLRGEIFAIIRTYFSSERDIFLEEDQPVEAEVLQNLVEALEEYTC